MTTSQRSSTDSAQSMGRSTRVRLLLKLVDYYTVGPYTTTTTGGLQGPYTTTTTTTSIPNSQAAWEKGLRRSNEQLEQMRREDQAKKEAAIQQLMQLRVQQQATHPLYRLGKAFLLSLSENLVGPIQCTPAQFQMVKAYLAPQGFGPQRYFWRGKELVNVKPEAQQDDTWRRLKQAKQELDLQKWQQGNQEQLQKMQDLQKFLSQL